MGNKVRIGIDVGGTFTDAVVIDNSTYEVIAKVKVPTTHHAEKGVAEGIIIAIEKILHENNIDPADVIFIAHGTTQATNALLEGDVARVGIVGMGTGIEASRAQKETAIGDIVLANNKNLHVSQTFLDSAKCTDEDIKNAIGKLKDQGAEVVVASAAYSVDDPTNEIRVIEAAHSMGLPSTGGHEISQLYGLLARTRTAAVNAALIPKMMETANLTENSVKEAHIDKPLMIMRCDGGVMSVAEVRKRPILTMLSGLAAGVAGALMYEKITDGIFMEVGGTSVDISAIKDGKVMIKNSEVGGHKLYLTSLDVRTLGVAGGSMIVIREGAIADIGPRSAHIADLEYEVFTEEANIQSPTIRLIAPCADDAPDYAAVSCSNGKTYALTLAGAANILGYIPDNDYAYGNKAAALKAWSALGEMLGMTAQEACRKAMDMACSKVGAIVEQLIREYDLNRDLIYLVGGGGSASVLAPALGEKMGMRSKIANNAPYISTIGVSMAMVMERLERNVVHPNADDIKRIRHDVTEMIVNAGASAETVEITVEIDSQKNILRAIATGATELRTKDMNSCEKSLEELAGIVRESAGEAEADVALIAEAGSWKAFAATTVTNGLFGILKKKKTVIRVIDTLGVIRLQKGSGSAVVIRKNEMASKLPAFIDERTSYNDAGAIPPRCFLFFRKKAVDLSGVIEKSQLMPLIDIEMEYLDEDEEVLIVASNN